MRIDLVRPDEITDDLAARWRAIQDMRDELQNPFFSPDFTKIVGRVRDDVEVAILERDGEIAGFFPFHRKRFGIGAPIGAQICDYQGPIAVPDLTLEAGPLLKGCRLAAYDFNHALRSEPMFQTASYIDHASPVIDLRAGGFEAWRADRKAATGKAITQTERKRRKIEREIGPLVYTAEDSDPAAWETMVAWKNASLHAVGARSILEVPWTLRVLETIRDTRTAAFAGMLSTLRAGDRLIAAHFGMRSARVWHWWFPTYDHRLTNMSPGLCLLWACARWTDDQAVDRIDLGRGTQEFKRQFGNTAVPLCEGSLERPARVAGLARRARKGIHGLADRTLPARYADLQRRAFNRVLGAGLV